MVGPILAPTLAPTLAKIVAFALFLALGFAAIPLMLRVFLWGQRRIGNETSVLSHSTGTSSMTERTKRRSWTEG